MAPLRGPGRCKSPRDRQGTMMLDLFLLVLGCGLFGLLAAYVLGCERV
jgi:hypothetical protein